MVTNRISAGGGDTVSNYEFTKLLALDENQNLRTRVCNVLEDPLDDCPPPYITSNGLRRLH